MLKKITLILGLLASAAGTAFATNVVTLDLNSVIEKFSKTAAVKAEVEADQKYAEETQKIKIDEFNKLREKLDAKLAELKSTRNNPTLSKSASAKTESEVEDLYKEAAETEKNLRQSQQEAQAFLQKKFIEGTNLILKEDILPRIEEIAKAHGAEIVLNARVGILYAAPTVDITEELLARLEKDFPAAEKKADVPEKKADVPEKK